MDALEIGLELRQALLSRHVERGQVRWSTKPLTRRPLLIWKRARPSRNSWSKVAPLRTRRQISFDDEMLPDRGDLGAGVATPERHLLAGGGPAAGGNDLPITLDSLLERGDLACAHERHVIR